MVSPTPHTIDIPNFKLERLKQKLAVADFPDELDGAGWDYGTPLSEVKRLATYWQKGFDWRKHEAMLNTLPNFTTQISVQGFGSLEIHFLHQLSSKSNAIPLLFVHGWPGSYLEVSKIMPLLTDPSDSSSPSFHVVAPSLPNFAWSEGSRSRGFGLAQYAETCHKLMVKLGYSQYVTQGGDWGFYITRTISLLYPSYCLATHINMIRASPPSFVSQPLAAAFHALTPYSKREREGLERSDWFANEGSGYKVIQCTKPQTPGYAVTDSPVGLLAWILEKLHDWTDSYPWSDDEILTWVSIYYFSRMGPAASFRIYFEATHPQPSQVPEGNKIVEGGFVLRERTQEWIGGGVKVGLAYFPRELSIFPKAWGRTLGDVKFVSEHSQGGHFAAHEKPEAIAGDLQSMFGKGGPCEGIIVGRTGY